MLVEGKISCRDTQTSLCKKATAQEMIPVGVQREGADPLASKEQLLDQLLFEHVVDSDLLENKHTCLPRYLSNKTRGMDYVG